MTKKHRIRGKLVFSAILIASFFIVSSDTYAKEATDKDQSIKRTSPSNAFCSDSSKVNPRDKEACKDAVKKCDDAIQNETDNYNIRASMDNNYKLTFSFNKHYAITVTDDDNNPISSGAKLSDGIFNSVTFSSNIKPTIVYHSVVDDKDHDISCRGEYAKTYMFTNEEIRGGSINNPAVKEGGICYKYFNGQAVGEIDGETSKLLDPAGTYSYQKMNALGEVSIKTRGGTKKYTFKGFLDEIFDYCNKTEVSYTLDEKYIKKVILIIAKTFKANFDVQEARYGENGIERTTQQLIFDSDAIKVEYAKVKDKSKPLKFTCTAFGPQVFNDAARTDVAHKNRYEAITDSKGKIIAYNNKRKFYTVGPIHTEKYVDTTQDSGRRNRNGSIIYGVEKDSCTVQCGEQVEVTYGPPVAVKGTVCFEYKVTVKSKIKCESKVIEGNAPVAPEITGTTLNVCNIKVHCNNSQGFLSGQAGPNEEFDKCITDKFNGKYTQKAIDYCYNKVYKKSSTTKVNSDLNFDTAQKVANTPPTCEWWNDSNELNKIAQTDSYTAQVKVYNHETGRYETQTKTIDNVVTELQNSARSGVTSGTYNKTSDRGYLGKYKTFSWTSGSCYWDRYIDAYKYDNTTVKALVYDDEIFTKPRGFNKLNDLCQNSNLKKCSRNIDKRVEIYKVANQSKGWTEFTNVDVVAHHYYFAKGGVKWSQYIGGNKLTGQVTLDNQYGSAGHTYGTSNPLSTSQAVPRQPQWYTNICQESCVIYTDSADQNCVAPGNTNVTPTIDDNEWKRYEQAVINYENSLKTCASKAKCVEKETVTHYRMATDDKLISTTGDTCTAESDSSKKNKNCWHEEKQKETLPVSIDDNGFTILNNANGICYANSNRDYHYVNIISFPTTWVARGKYKVRRTKPSEEEYVLFKPHKNAYCLDPSTPDTNKTWWDWDVKYSGSQNRHDNQPASKTGIDSIGQSYLYIEGTDFNIKGVITNFGYFDWNIDVSCFFAYSNIGSGDDDDDHGDDDDDDDTKKTVENIYTRAAALDELFPSVDETTSGVASNINSDEIIPQKLNNTTEKVEKVEKVANTEDRTPGYNWSCDATNLMIKHTEAGTSDYVIAPSALRYQIETKEKSGTKTYTDKEIDYEITLTSKDIKQIKSDYKNVDFFDFSDGEYHDVKYTFGPDNKTAVISFYKSKILDTYDTAIRRTGYCNNFIEGTDDCDSLKTSIDSIKNDNTVYSCQKLREESE